jgi:hypothetical protein
MTNRDISRRDFLKTSGIVVTAAALGTGTAALIIPDQSWAATLEVFDEHQAATLLHLTREIFPHQGMADIYYAVVVRDLDAEAQGDAATAKLLKDGVAELDQALGIPWTQLSEGYRAEVLATRTDSAWFNKVRGKAVVSLYNNDLAWRYFGYEGPSFPRGGYIIRGFDDLNWLPAPPAEASPPPFKG